ncbi:MAG: phosphate ABC transporter substrate-binding protein [Pseudomonadales bacterium]|nr:phosphate ABC transporter substrate-binding protein [Pseudomonadales bacterium]
MKKRLLTLKNALKALIMSAMLAFSGWASANIAIVVHPDNNSVLEKKDIVRLFLAKVKTFPDGEKATPIDQMEGTRARHEFLENLLGKSEDQLRSYWARLIFTGRVLPPRTANSDGEVKKLVAQNPELIGYIQASEVDDTVKVVATFP